MAGAQPRRPAAAMKVLMEQVKGELEGQVKNARTGAPTSASLHHLDRILREVNAMEAAMSPQKFRPSYNRLIADSWDTNDTLGTRLLELAQQYNKLG